MFDVKYLLSPLVNNGSAAEHIQMNFNTVRRLHDDEGVVAAGCLSESVVIMFWFEMENENANESPVYQSVSKLLTTNPLYPDIATTIRMTVDKYKEGDNATFGYRRYLDAHDLSQRGQFEYIDYAAIGRRIEAIAVAMRHILKLTPSAKVKVFLSRTLTDFEHYEFI